MGRVTQWRAPTETRRAENIQQYNYMIYVENIGIISSHKYTLYMISISWAHCQYLTHFPIYMKYPYKTTEINIVILGRNYVCEYVFT